MGSSLPPSSGLPPRRGSPLMLTSTSWQHSGETAQPTPKKEKKRAPTVSSGAAQPTVTGTLCHLGTPTFRGAQSSRHQPQMSPVPTANKLAHLWLQTYNPGEPLHRIKPSPIIPWLAGKGREQGWKRHWVEEAPGSPARPHQDPHGVMVLMLPPQFFSSEPRSRLRWLLLPGEAELLPRGPKSILRAEGSSRDSNPPNRRHCSPRRMLWGGFVIRQEHLCHPREDGQGFGWQLGAEAQEAAPEGLPLAPAQRRLHRNR